MLHMFAIIQCSGKQFIVSSGETITVPHLPGNVGDVIQIPEVLLVTDDKKTTIGTPFVKGTTVEAKIVRHYKGEKLTVRRFKSKVRYRKTRGFRPQMSEIEITKIE